MNIKSAFLFILKAGYLALAAHVFIAFISPAPSDSWPMEALLAHLLLLSFPLGFLWLLAIAALAMGLNALAFCCGFPAPDSLFFDWLGMALTLMVIPIGYWQ